MKKILTIAIVLLFASVAFFSCDDREYPGASYYLADKFEKSETAIASYLSIPSGGTAIKASNKITFTTAGEYVEITLPATYDAYKNIKFYLTKEGDGVFTDFGYDLVDGATLGTAVSGTFTVPVASLLDPDNDPDTPAPAAAKIYLGTLSGLSSGTSVTYSFNAIKFLN